MQISGRPTPPRSRARAWSSPGRSGGWSAQRASPLWPRTTWKVWRSSRIGLWLSSSRSVSPRVPTVEYARSERSSAKSSQAARNSALSAARSLGAAPPPGGVELEERELDERAVGHETKGSARRARGRGARLRPCRGSRASAQCAAERHGRSRRCPTGRRRAPSSAGVPGALVGVLSAGIGQVPAGADLPRHLPGQPVFDVALRPAAAAASRRFGARVPGMGGRSSTRRQRPGRDRPRAARLEPAGRRDPRSDGRPRSGSAALIAATRDGAVGRRRLGASARLAVAPRESASFGKLAAGLRGDDLLIAFARAAAAPSTARSRSGSPGTASTATSPRTRPGPTATCSRPTSRRRSSAASGLPVPDEMNGEPIRAEGSVDPGRGRRTARPG